MSLLKYFASLPRGALDRLYADGWTCQGVLRALPPVARLYVLRLVAVSAEEGSEGLPKDVVAAWARPTSDGRAKHEDAMGKLRRLNLIVESQAAVRLHCGFASQLLDSLCVGGVLTGEQKAGVGGSTDRGRPLAGATDRAASSSTPAQTLVDLERRAHDTWASVLQAVFTPPQYDVALAMTCEGATLQELLQEARLLRPLDADDGDRDDAGRGAGATLGMTREAPRFLLQPTHAQVWRLVRAYMELAERGTPGTRHATLCFLMRLGLLELGRAYRMDDASLDEAQRAALTDMALLGLVYRPSSQPSSYYATPLAQHLLSGAAAGAAAAAGSSATGPSASSGFMVVETNFRLYAYTSSPLWAQVLRIFARLECATREGPLPAPPSTPQPPPRPAYRPQRTHTLSLAARSALGAGAAAAGG